MNPEVIDHCCKCKYFEVRTHFCRKYPPTPLTVIENNKSFYTSTFPKIQLPELDYCFEFDPIINFVE